METIEFIFDSRPDNSVLDANVTSLILLFDIGSNSDDTYYFDNVYGPEFNNQCASINSNPSINLALGLSLEYWSLSFKYSMFIL